MAVITRSIPALNQLQNTQWPETLNLMFSDVPVAVETACAHLAVHAPAYVVCIKERGVQGGWSGAKFVRSDEGLPRHAHMWKWYIVHRVMPKPKKAPQPDTTQFANRR